MSTYVLLNQRVERLLGILHANNRSIYSDVVFPHAA